MSGVLGLSLLGGVAALDGTSVGQVMISRPLVVGFLAGALVGDPLIGATVGALLELYLLVSYPSGGVRFPEGATATVVAVASATVVEGPGSLAVGVALGLVWGQVGGLSITALRHGNGRLAPEPGQLRRPSRFLPARHLTALVLDLVRGVAVSATGILLGTHLVQWVAPHWPLDGGAVMGLLLSGAAASTGIYLRDLGGLGRRPFLLVLGLGVGLVLGWFGGGGS